MLDKIISLIAPHRCCFCQKLGSILCDGCGKKYRMENKKPLICILCGDSASSLCQKCSNLIDGAWFVLGRDDNVRNLIENFKFKGARSLVDTFSSWMNIEIGDVLSPNAIVTPIPTVRSHVRQRGFDHSALLARSLAKKKSLPYRSILQRKNNYRQVGASSRVRVRQAKNSYFTNKDLSGLEVLLVDDISTTGATLKYAADVLKKAGASKVYLVALVKNSLK